MSYTPTEWKTGDVVTSAKLNKMEQGIADGGGLIVGATYNNAQKILDKTFAEIFEAFGAGKMVIFREELGGNYVIMSAISQIGTESYEVQFGPAGAFSAESADGYPSSGGGK